MKRLFPILLAALALASCQRDNYFKEFGEEDIAPQYHRLADDKSQIHAPVAYRGGYIPVELQEALKKRTPLLGGELVLDSEMVLIGEGFLTDNGTTPSDSLIETAYHNGIIVAVVNPDYEKLSAWCDKKGIVFPAVPSEDDHILLCAFSNRGWLYDMDDPRYKDPTAKDYRAWLNPFVAWVNAHVSAETTPKQYRIGSGEDLVFERNLACQKYDHTYFLALNDTISCIHPYKADTLKVLSQMTAHFTSWPVSEAERDWYLCHASLSIDNAPMFCDVAVSTSGGTRTKFCGYEMRQAGFSFDIGAGPQGPGGFIEGPLPGSTAAGEPFHPDFDWTLEESGALTEGPVTAKRSAALTVDAPLLHKGERTASLPELDLENKSAGGRVEYLFTVPSELLGYMHRTEIYPSEAAVCRTGCDNLETSWVWCCPKSDMTRTLRVGTKCSYTSMFFRSTSVGAGRWNEHAKALSSTSRSIRLLSPGRMLTGQLQLENDYDDAASCVAFSFWAEGRDPEKEIPDYDAQPSVVAPGDAFVRNMEAGRYLMRFYKKSADGQNMWLCERTVEITAAQATVISASDCLPK